MTFGSNLLSLKPTVSREDAIGIFSRSGFRSWPIVREICPLRSTAELYVPFVLFRATIRKGSKCDIRLLAVDRFSGGLDPFVFDQQPSSNNLISLETRNRLDCVLSKQQAEKALTTKLQRMLFQKGFFRASGIVISLTSLSEFHMPYWLGFFGSGATASLKILDATRRVYEGNKLRVGVEEWLSR